MEIPPTPPTEATPISPSMSLAHRAVHTFFGAIRTRIVSGLILALPIAITFWILYQLYLILQRVVIAPMDWLFQQILGRENLQGLPIWWNNYVAPLIAIVAALGLLYFLGLFVSTRLARVIDWLMSSVPLVTTIYQAVRGVFHSLASPNGGAKFKRVVSVAYPHPGVRVPGFVMKSMRDIETGRSILSVFVPFAPLPTSGFVLLVPEEEVIDIGWSVNEAMQGVVSGGLSMPSTLRFTAKASREIERPIVP